MLTNAHRPGQLHLNAFMVNTGHHDASWRLPESDALNATTSIAYEQRMAQIAEAGTFDSIFLADSPSLQAGDGRSPSASLDPLIVLTAIAGVTTHIGLIASASTTYNSPYNLARRLASIDHVSGGRAGWNVVTTAGALAARNFDLEDQPAHAARYRRATEFMEVVQRLWDSWEDDAILADKESGVWADVSKIHPAGHVGEHFSVRGALTTPRSPQARPLIVQAGSSEDGRTFAARFAEAVFTAHQTLGEARAFYADLKARAAAAGRDADKVTILPGIVPVIGSTEAQAREQQRELDELILPEHMRAQLARGLGLTPADLPLDRELPADLPTEEQIQGSKSRFSLILAMARRERLTVRALIGRLSCGRGHRAVVGTPEQIADAMQEWYDAGAADGYNVMPAVMPSGLVQFVEHVVPILRSRGLFRTEYTGWTLREHYGLERPIHPSVDGDRQPSAAPRWPRQG